jgi:PAS domain S-box-containing protein
MSSLNDRRLRTLVDATSSVLLTTKADGRVVERQPSWERFTGQRWPTYRGTGWLDAVHGRDIDLNARSGEATGRRTGRTSAPIPIRARLWHRDTHGFRHVRGRAVPLLDERGRLAEWVVSLEDVHEHFVAQRRLEETASRLNAVLRHSPVGLALFDGELRLILSNDALARASGLDPERDRGRTLDEAAPALAAHLAPRLDHVLVTGEPVSGIELRGVALGGGGRTDWLVSCYPIARADDSLLGVGATFVDVTDRNALQALVQEAHEREARDRFRSALDAMLDLVMILRAERDDRGRIVDFRVEHVNRSRQDVAGRSAPELVGRTMSELYPGFGGSRLLDRYVEVVETREPLTIDEFEYRDTVDGRVVDGVLAMQITPFEDGLMSVTHDVTERRRRRVQLERTYEQLAAAQSLAHIGIWELDLASGRVVFSDELHRILGLPSDAGPFDIDEMIDRFVHPDHHDLVRSLARVSPEGGEPFAVDIGIIRTDGEPRTVSLFGSISRDHTGAPVRMWGTLQDVTRHREAEEELRAAAVRLERERAVVTHLQEALLPEAPAVPGLDLAVRYLPAGTEAKVGGDWYDVMPLDEHRVLLAVGDVAGHGLAAAALMAQLRNALRGAAFAGQGPDEVLCTLATMLLRTAPDAMATASCGIYDPRRAVFEWASAGHPPPVLHRPEVRAPTAVLLDDPAGPPLGLPRAAYDLRTTELPAGSTLVLYTDGLVEERGRNIDEGLARLLDMVGSMVDRPVDELRDGITVGLFADRERRDDMCLLVARVPIN